VNSFKLTIGGNNIYKKQNIIVLLIGLQFVDCRMEDNEKPDSDAFEANIIYVMLIFIFTTIGNKFWKNLP